MSALYDVKIEIFIPEDFTDKLIDELSKVSVGRIGNYDHCAAVSSVRGTWRPLPGANPYEGEIGAISQAAEHKVEVNCRKENVRAALQVIHSIHPYDQPVVNVIQLSNASFES